MTLNIVPFVDRAPPPAAAHITAARVSLREGLLEKIPDAIGRAAFGWAWSGSPDVAAPGDVCVPASTERREARRADNHERP